MPPTTCPNFPLHASDILVPNFLHASDILVLPVPVSSCVQVPSMQVAKLGSMKVMPPETPPQSSTTTPAQIVAAFPRDSGEAAVSAEAAPTAEALVENSSADVPSAAIGAATGAAPPSSAAVPSKIMPEQRDAAAPQDSKDVGETTAVTLDAAGAAEQTGIFAVPSAEQEVASPLAADVPEKAEGAYALGDQVETVHEAGISETTGAAPDKIDIDQLSKDELAEKFRMLEEQHKEELQRQAELHKVELEHLSKKNAASLREGASSQDADEIKQAQSLVRSLLPETVPEETEVEISSAASNFKQRARRADSVPKRTRLSGNARDSKIVGRHAEVC